MTGKRGRRKRAERRSAVREAAKLLVHQAPGSKDSRWGYVLACLGVAIAITIVLAPPQTPISTGTWLSALFGVLLYPAFCLAHWTLPTTARWITRAVAVVGLACILFPLGIRVWPRGRHNLSERERYAFERPLREQKVAREEIQIACPQDDEKTCVYAAQFIDFFREAGWTVQGNQLERVTLAKPLAGVTLFKHGSGKLDPSNWRSGLWAALSPSVESVYQAFVNVGIEPDSGANPQLPEGIITVYFGPEKYNPAASTLLGEAIRSVEQARRRGAIPGPK
jgi:hypothetical protein